jgi:histidinol-phosphatase (PHP family)
MLTDYHVHLRPDDLAATAEEHFTAENVDRYLGRARDVGIGELGVAEHVYRFEQALEIWRHPFWEEQARDDLDAYCEFVRTTPLRLGIEMDYVPGAEDRIAALIEAREFDYVVGSVHFVGDRAVDHGGYDIWEADSDPDAVWARYFGQLAAAARSGLFEIIAHPDLVKMWGAARPAPHGDRRRYYEPAVEALAEADVAIEVSTAGLRKPVGELYPSGELARMCVEADIPFSLSSDAHCPEDVGYSYEDAVRTMEEWGIAQIATFERRRRRMEPLG